MHLPAAICVIGGVLVGAANAQSVSVKDGNVFITAAGKSEQLTSSGQASDPSLSPDGRTVAFVRATPDRKVFAGSGDDTSELWLMATDGSSATRLLEPHSAKKMENVVALIGNPHFSFDGTRIYFETTAWVTSGAVHVYELKTKRQHFVVAGNDFRIVRAAGDYRDCLLVQQHRYFVGGGSFDWYYLFHPDGKEIGPVGEDTKNFEESYALDTPPQPDRDNDPEDE